MAGERMTQILKKGMEKSESDIMFGEIVSVSPLKLKLEADITIDEEFIHVGILCKYKQAVSISHSHTLPTGKTGDTVVTVPLWGGLKIGDKVVVIVSSNGQLYYILEVVA